MITADQAKANIEQYNKELRPKQIADDLQSINFAIERDSKLGKNTSEMVEFRDYDDEVIKTVASMGFNITRQISAANQEKRVYIITW